MLQTSILTIMEDDRKLSKFIFENFKDVKFNVSSGNETLITKTNIKKINPVIYKIKTSKSSITILYFKSDDIKDKKYYIPKLKQDYSLSELKEYLKGVL